MHWRSKIIKKSVVWRSGGHLGKKVNRLGVLDALWQSKITKKCQKDTVFSSKITSFRRKSKFAYLRRKCTSLKRNVRIWGSGCQKDIVFPSKISSFHRESKFAYLRRKCTSLKRNVRIWGTGCQKDTAFSSKISSFRRKSEFAYLRRKCTSLKRNVRIWGSGPSKLRLFDVGECFGRRWGLQGAKKEPCRARIFPHTSIFGCFLD